MRGSTLRPVVFGGAALLTLSACGLSLVLGYPDPLEEDGGLDAQTSRDATSDAYRADASLDAGPDATKDGGADATPDKDAGRDAGKDAGKDADAGPQERHVFISNATYSGLQIAGLAGGDTICQTEATAALLPGTYHAILGQNETYAAIVARIGDRPVPIVDVDEIPIADNIVALLKAAPTLDNAITLDAAKAPHVNAIVWTGISAGAASTGASTNHCVNWTSASAQQMGVVGKAAAKNEEFLMSSTGQGLDSCDKLRRIYCLEE